MQNDTTITKKIYIRLEKAEYVIPRKKISPGRALENDIHPCEEVVCKVW